MALLPRQLSGTFPATVVCGFHFPSVVHCRLLTFSLCFPPSLGVFSPFSSCCVCSLPRASVPLTDTASVIVTICLKQLLCALLLQEAQCTARLCGHHHHCLSHCFCLSTSVLYYVKQTGDDQWEQLFIGSTVASWNTASWDHIPG